MGIFNEFNKKEKPVFTGFRFGFGGRGSASAADASEPDVIASGGFVSDFTEGGTHYSCLLYTSPSPRDGLLSRMPSSA